MDIDHSPAASWFKSDSDTKQKENIPMATPRAQKIMIIRHAEKPTTNNSDPYGVNDNGETDGEGLTVQGWQRAGALAVLFAPSHGSLQNAELATPGVLFAAAVAKHSKSERPEDTITPLSQKLATQIDSRYTKGQEAAVAEAAVASDGVVLICWQHQDIPTIANAILDNQSTVPQKWPGERFDLVWVFDLDQNSGAYRFCQVPQQLLKGDLATIIA
ncbi:hypothetical protein QU481_09225 [Crenobacter sp. SG2303]|uniref:Histidine phosphatase family protein n=1 Tax=Crenobacter oryzisoli TaxID=3056844 RepID=A0ABT7XMR3_9NEIS|nr:hypothetical protein [Crenobacter sp. SG2303]MDN0075074.1 hypothetical protein [Crenobacter sp. SG2303]